MSSRASLRLGRMAPISATTPEQANAQKNTNDKKNNTGLGASGGIRAGNRSTIAPARATPLTAPRRQGSAASAATSPITIQSEKPKLLRVANSASRSRTDLASTLEVR